MDNFLVKGTLACVAASLVVASPAQAGAGCWQPAETSALRLKDLQSKLMVATLRCNAMGYDQSSAYNRFVTANKPTLAAANRTVKTRFENAYGKRWLTEYDRFNTSLANAYGAGQTSADICKETGRLAREGAAASGNSARLLDIADRMGSPPPVKGGHCSARYAAR